MGMVSSARTSDSLMCSVIGVSTSIRSHRLPALWCGFRRGGGGAAGFLRGFVTLGNAADDRLDQTVDTIVFFAGSHGVKAEFGLAAVVLVDADGKLAAGVVFDEGRFVAAALGVPGVHAKHREVAGLALGPFRAGNQILRLVAVGAIRRG